MTSNDQSRIQSSLVCGLSELGLLSVRKPCRGGLADVYRFKSYYEIAWISKLIQKKKIYLIFRFISPSFGHVFMASDFYCRRVLEQWWELQHLTQLFIFTIWNAPYSRLIWLYVKFPLSSMLEFSCFLCSSFALCFPVYKLRPQILQLHNNWVYFKDCNDILCKSAHSLVTSSAINDVYT